MQTIHFYHESYQFASVQTEKFNAKEIEAKLVKNKLGNPCITFKGSFWATVNEGRNEVARYQLNSNNEIEPIIFNKQ